MTSGHIEAIGVLMLSAAAVALLVSRNANTSGVESASLFGLAGFVGAAISPSGVGGGSNQSAVANPNSSPSLAYAPVQGAATSGYSYGGTVTPQNVGGLIQNLQSQAGSGNTSAQAVLSTVNTEAALIQGGSNNPGAGANTSTSVGGGSVGFSGKSAVTGAKVASVIGSFGGPVGTLAGAIVGALLGGFIGGSTGGTEGRSYTGEQTYGAGQSPGDATGSYGAAGYGQGAGGSSMSGGGAEAGSEGATGGSA